GMADGLLDRQCERRLRGELDLATDGDARHCLALELGDGELDRLIRRLRHAHSARPREPAKNARSARIARAKRIGWTIAPPAIAMTSRTMPMMSQSMEVLLPMGSARR